MCMIYIKYKLLFSHCIPVSKTHVQDNFVLADAKPFQSIFVVSQQSQDWHEKKSLPDMMCSCNLCPTELEINWFWPSMVFPNLSAFLPLSDGKKVLYAKVGRQSCWKWLLMTMGEDVVKREAVGGLMLIRLEEGSIKVFYQFTLCSMDLFFPFFRHLQ